ncbi:DUF2303 family protein, partial [Escherichia coli]|nr:DUF2303 family protein [Escherichia coli]
KKQLQKSLAEWLEDWADFLTAYDSDGNVLDIKQAISAVRRLTIDAKRSAEYEEQNFSGSRSVMESVEAKSKEIMPATFRFECIPYEGLGNREFTLRLSILTSEQPVLVLRIVRVEAAEEEIAKEFRDLLKERFEEEDILTFIGTFSV